VVLEVTSEISRVVVIALAAGGVEKFRWEPIQHAAWRQQQNVWNCIGTVDINAELTGKTTRLVIFLVRVCAVHISSCRR
jgi:hypothetical protein